MTMRALLLLPFLCALPARQAIAQQQPLGEFYDYTFPGTDTTTLISQLDSLVSSGDTTTPALLRRGFVRLKLAEMRNLKEEGRIARRDFERAVKLSGANPWSHFGLALSHRIDSGLASTSVLRNVTIDESLAEILGRDPISRAVASLRRALELQPDFAPAALTLADIALHLQHKEWLRISSNSLALIAGQGNGTAAGALARVHSALGDPNAALAAADLAERSGGAGAAEAGYARAISMLLNPRTVEDGARAYFRYLAEHTPVLGKLYYKDIELIATDREAAAWKAAAPSEILAFIENFWARRAALSGVTVASRMAEHYARRSIAYERYRRSGTRGAPPENAIMGETYADRSADIDERGVMLIRHGTPHEIVRTISSELRPTETWVYLSEVGQNELYHFVKFAGGTEYYLVSDIFSAVDATTTSPPVDALQSLLRGIGRFDPRYTLMAVKVEGLREKTWTIQALNAIGASGGLIAALSEEARDGAVMLQSQRMRVSEERMMAGRAAMIADSHRPTFLVELPFYYDVYTFKGPDHRTDVTAAIAVPGHLLTPAGSTGNFTYGVDVSIIIADTAAGRITRTDTTFHFKSRRTLAKGEYMRVHADLVVDTVRGALQRVILRDSNNPDAGQLYGGRITVPSYAGEKLRVSDVILAEPTGGAWRRGIVDLAFVPPRQFKQGAPAKLFYEIYNLPANVNYITEIAIKSTDRRVGLTRILRRASSLSLRFEGVTSANQSGVLQELRQISTELRPGRYMATVQVTNTQTQETAKNSTEFIVVPLK